MNKGDKNISFMVDEVMPFIFVEKDISLTLVQHYYFSGSRADIEADFVSIHNSILLIRYINNESDILV